MGSVRHRHLGVIVIAAVGLGVMAGATEAEGSKRELVGDRYRSISAVRDGESHDLVEGTRIRVRFRRQDGNELVSWRAGCNHFGARVKVRPRRLVTGRSEGTAVGCNDALHRQDRWLARFFRRDPRWVRRGTRLRLRSGDDVIRFRRR